MPSQHAGTELGAGTTDAPDPDAARSAWRAIRLLAHDPQTLQRLHRSGERLGVTTSMAKALVHLSGDRPGAMRSLADALRCDTSYVTTVVDALEARGLAHRQPHPTDRRVKIVVPSEAGRAVAKEVSTAFDEPPPSFARLAPDEVQVLADLLERLVDVPES